MIMSSWLGVLYCVFYITRPSVFAWRRSVSQSACCCYCGQSRDYFTDFTRETNGDFEKQLHVPGKISQSFGYARVKAVAAKTIAFSQKNIQKDPTKPHLFYVKKYNLVGTMQVEKFFTSLLDHRATLSPDVTNYHTSRFDISWSFSSITDAIRGKNNLFPWKEDTYFLRFKLATWTTRWLLKKF